MLFHCIGLEVIMPRLLHESRQNHLLAALPVNEFARLLPHLDAVTMPLGHVLHESGVPMRHVYFPTSAIVSLLYVMEDGASAEIAMVGNEGVVGISLFMGGNTMPSRAVVRGAGTAYRVKAPLLKEVFERDGGAEAAHCNTCCCVTFRRC